MAAQGGGGADGRRQQATVDQTLAARWTGTKWVTVPSPRLGKVGNQLPGVFAVSAHDIWAVGENEDTGTPAGVIHWYAHRCRLNQP